jgi:hypothetical protein
VSYVCFVRAFCVCVGVFCVHFACGLGMSGGCCAGDVRVLCVCCACCVCVLCEFCFGRGCVCVDLSVCCGCVGVGSICAGAWLCI